MIQRQMKKKERLELRTRRRENSTKCNSKGRGNVVQLTFLQNKFPNHSERREKVTVIAK